MKKLLSLIMVLILVTGILAGCSSKQSDTKDTSSQNSDRTSVSDEEDSQDSQSNNLESEEEKSNPDTANPGEEENSQSDNTNPTDDTGFTLEYPADMQAMGFTEPVVLESRPERVVCLSAAPVLALYELGVTMVGIPNSMVVTWPEDLAASTATVSFSVMNSEDFDYESVVALEPDLVMLAMNGAETAGAKLESLGIHVYYLYAGHTVSYDSIKMQTMAFVNAFDIDGSGDAIIQRFTDLEASLEDARAAFSGKSVMVLQSADAQTHYIQTKDGTLGSMLDMLGFDNVYVNDTSSMVQLDYEQALDYDPDYVVCVGGTDAATHQTVMEEAFQNNPDYWNAIKAVEDGNVTCVDVTYCSTAGLNIIDNITALIDIMSEATGIAVE